MPNQSRRKAGLPRSGRMSTAMRANRPRSGGSGRPDVAQKSCSSVGLDVFSSRRRARRPRSFRSTRPLSASSTIRSASFSASSMIGAPDRRVLAHVVEDRALGPAGDDRVRDALDPDARPVASATLLADDRLDGVDLVRPRVLAEAEEDHPAAVRHDGIIAGGGDLRFSRARKALFWGSLGALGMDARRLSGSPPRRLRGCGLGRSGRGTSSPPSRSSSRRTTRRSSSSGGSRTCSSSTIPPDKLDIVVVSDASTDRTDELVESFAAQTSRGSSADCLARRKDRGTGSRGAGDERRGPRLLGREHALEAGRASQARPQLRRPGGGVRLRQAFLRAAPTARTAKGSTRASRAGSGGTSRASGRSPAASGRSTQFAASDYIELDPRLGHDVVLPYLLVQRGRRADRRARRRWRGRSPRATSRTSTAGRSACSSTPG